MNSSDSFDVSGRTVAIVGATGGLGQQIVRTLTGSGMRAFVHGFNNSKGLNDVLDLEGVEEGYLADLRSAEAIDDLCGRIVAWSAGALDALVYAAGINPTAARTRDVSIEDWDTTLAINLRGAFLVLRNLLPALSAANGSVVLVSSIFGVQSPANRVAYSASKHGMAALVQAIVREEGDRIHINAIAPGPAWGANVRHIFTEHAEELGMTIEEYVKSRTERIPMRRFLEPSEMANLTLFLCSPRSSYLNGQTLVLAGGAAE